GSSGDIRMLMRKEHLGRSDRFERIHRFGMKHRPSQSRLLGVAAVLAATLACYFAFPGFAATGGPQCSYDVLPGAKSYDAAGTSGAPDFVDVATPAGCPWTAVSNVDWLVITNGQDHVGPGNVAFLVQPNTGPPNAVTMARLGTMTIAGLTFT